MNARQLSVLVSASHKGLSSIIHEMTDNEASTEVAEIIGAQCAALRVLEDMKVKVEL